MSDSLPTVAIVGRPNVGKSTLFNRIIGQRRAIVDDMPGVTRDRNFALGEWAGRSFWVVDTGGVEPDADAQLPSAVQRQVDAAIAEADVLLFVVDGMLGAHPIDQHVADLLRRTKRPVVLAVNKVDNLPNDHAHHEFWALGLGEPRPVSAVSGRGSGDLLDAVVAVLPERSSPPNPETTLRIAVVGKPNVGKSSFVNLLIGEERLVVSDVAGTTRDAVDTTMRYKGHDLVFVDTAGLRRQARIGRGLEYYAALRTERAIQGADVCILLIDATEPVHTQDLRIAEKAWEHGCALILVANKWDLVDKDDRTAGQYAKQLRERAPSLRWVPILFTSALTGQRVRRVLDLILEVAGERARRIPTHEVNELVARLANRVPPPHHRGTPVKLFYATQVGTRPPTFVIFVNTVRGMPTHYVRYLRNGFRDAWGFEGSPLRIRLRRRSEKKTA